MHDLSHCATTVCEATADHALAFIAEPARLGEWALGCWGAEPVDGDTVRGTSLFDGEQSLVRVEPSRAALTVDFLVAGDDGEMVPRISARVVPGPVVGRSPGQCLVTVTAWRTLGMSDGRWARLVASHEAEILILKARIEGA
jgi:hypothetical protein